MALTCLSRVGRFDIMATASMTAPIGIRRATADDLPALTTLMREADERPYSEEDVRWILRDLDESRFVAWIAHAGDFPCGITMLQRTTLCWKGRRYRAGFWVNLYVHPTMRHTRLFPRLVMTMFQAARSLEFDILFAATRRPQVAEANLALGMTEVGKLPLYGKLLRPAHLIVKYRRLGFWSQPFAGLIDIVYSSMLRLRSAPASNPDLSWGDDRVAAVTSYRNEVSRDLVFTPYDHMTFPERYRRGPDGGSYHLIASFRDGRPDASVVWRMAERGPGVRAGIVMDVIDSGREPNTTCALLQYVHRCALNQGAEIVLAIPGWGPQAIGVLSSLGYLRLPETYTLMARPVRPLPDDFPLHSIALWRYTYGDNDAF